MGRRSLPDASIAGSDGATRLSGRATSENPGVVAVPRKPNHADARRDDIRSRPARLGGPPATAARTERRAGAASRTRRLSGRSAHQRRLVLRRIEEVAGAEVMAEVAQQAALARRAAFEQRGVGRAETGAGRLDRLLRMSLRLGHALTTADIPFSGISGSPWRGQVCMHARTAWDAVGPATARGGQPASWG